MSQTATAFEKSSKNLFSLAPSTAGMNNHRIDQFQLGILWNRRGKSCFSIQKFIKDGDDSITHIVFREKCSGRRLLGKIVTQFSEGEVRYWPFLNHRSLAPFLESVPIKRQVSIFMSTYLDISLRKLVHDPDFVNNLECYNLKKGYLEDVLWGLDYLHNGGLCLMNISDANIFVSKTFNKAVITDFSCLTTVMDAQRDKFASIPNAPEMSLPASPSDEWNPVAAEMWTTGVMAMELFVHHMVPWSLANFDFRQALKVIDKIDYDVLKVANAGSIITFRDLRDFKAFVKLFLSDEPSERCSASDAAKSAFLLSYKPHSHVAFSNLAPPWASTTVDANYQPNLLPTSKNPFLDVGLAPKCEIDLEKEDYSYGMNNLNLNTESDCKKSENSKNDGDSKHNDNEADIHPTGSSIKEIRDDPWVFSTEAVLHELCKKALANPTENQQSDKPTNNQFKFCRKRKRPLLKKKPEPKSNFPILNTADLDDDDASGQYVLNMNQLWNQKKQGPRNLQPFTSTLKNHNAKDVWEGTSSKTIASNKNVFASKANGCNKSVSFTGFKTVADELNGPGYVISQDKCFSDSFIAQQTQSNLLRNDISPAWPFRKVGSLHSPDTGFHPLKRNLESLDVTTLSRPIMSKDVDPIMKDRSDYENSDPMTPVHPLERINEFMDESRSQEPKQSEIFKAEVEKLDFGMTVPPPIPKCLLASRCRPLFMPGPWKTPDEEILLQRNGGYGRHLGFQRRPKCLRHHKTPNIHYQRHTECTPFKCHKYDFWNANKAKAGYSASFEDSSSGSYHLNSPQSHLFVPTTAAAAEEEDRVSQVVDLLKESTLKQNSAVSLAAIEFAGCDVGFSRPRPTILGKVRPESKAELLPKSVPAKDKGTPEKQPNPMIQINVTNHKSVKAKSKKFRRNKSNEKKKKADLKRVPSEEAMKTVPEQAISAYSLEVMTSPGKENIKFSDGRAMKKKTPLYYFCLGK